MVVHEHDVTFSIDIRDNLLVPQINDRRISLLFLFRRRGLSYSLCLLFLLFTVRPPPPPAFCMSSILPFFSIFFSFSFFFIVQSQSLEEGIVKTDEIIERIEPNFNQKKTYNYRSIVR